MPPPLRASRGPVKVVSPPLVGLLNSRVSQISSPRVSKGSTSTQGLTRLEGTLTSRVVLLCWCKRGDGAFTLPLAHDQQFSDLPRRCHRVGCNAMVMIADLAPASRSQARLLSPWEQAASLAVISRWLRQAHDRS